MRLLRREATRYLALFAFATKRSAQRNLALSAIPPVDPTYFQAFERSEARKSGSGPDDPHSRSMRRTDWRCTTSNRCLIKGSVGMVLVGMPGAKAHRSLSTLLLSNSVRSRVPSARCDRDAGAARATLDACWDHCSRRAALTGGHHISALVQSGINAPQGTRRRSHIP